MDVNYNGNSVWIEHINSC
ncbi:hypothetical protein [Clostridium beijerinckii]